MSALKDLFTDIAGAIRETLPDEPAMSPYSYPEKIRKVASTGGSSGGAFIYKSGEINISSASKATIQHNSGQIPDMILLFPITLVTEGGYITHYIGYSNSYLEALGSDAKCYSTSIIKSTGNPFNANSTIGFDSESISSALINYGFVHNVTSTSFDIGGDATLYPGVTYIWIAISGIA